MAAVRSATWSLLVISATWLWTVLGLRLGAQVEAASDGGVVAVGKEFEDLAFATGELGDGIGWGVGLQFGEVGEDAVRKAGAERGFAVRRRPYGVQHLVGLGASDEVAARAGA